MICPKCGASQADGRQECSRCGVVFSRMQLRPQRPRTLSSTPVPSEPEPQRIPVPILVAAAILIILVGLIWTKHHRDAKARQPTADDILNQINNAQIQKARDRNAARLAEMQRQQRAVAPAAKDLDEQSLRAMIEQCSYFNERIGATLPKSFSSAVEQWTMEKNPTLATAVNEHLVDLDRGATVRVNLRVPQALVASETSDEYRLDMGRRRINTLTIADVNEASVRVDMTWTLEHPEAAALAPEGRERTGGALIARRSGQWFLYGAWRLRNGVQERICP